MSRRYPLCVFSTTVLALAAVLLSPLPSTAVTNVVPFHFLCLARHSSKTDGATNAQDASAETQAAHPAIFAHSSVWRYGQQAATPLLLDVGSRRIRPRCRGGSLGNRRRGPWGLVAVSM